MAQNKEKQYVFLSKNNFQAQKMPQLSIAAEIHSTVRVLF